jgi:hypothetical protein
LEAPLYISEKDTPFKAGKSAQKLVIWNCFFFLFFFFLRQKTTTSWSLVHLRFTFFLMWERSYDTYGNR